MDFQNSIFLATKVRELIVDISGYLKFKYFDVFGGASLKKRNHKIDFHKRLGSRSQLLLKLIDIQETNFSKVTFWGHVPPTFCALTF